VVAEYLRVVDHGAQLIGVRYAVRETLIERRKAREMPGARTVSSLSRERRLFERISNDPTAHLVRVERREAHGGGKRKLPSGCCDVANVLLDRLEHRRRSIGRREKRPQGVPVVVDIASILVFDGERSEHGRRRKLE